MLGHRPFTYVILAINALFLILLIAGVGGATGDVPYDCEYWGSLCGDALIQAALEVAMKIILCWGFVDTTLGFVWSMTNDRYKAKKAAEPTPTVASAR